MCCRALRWILPVAIVLCSARVIASPTDETDEQVFERVFARPVPVDHVPVMLVLNGVSKITVVVRTSNGHVYVSTPSLLEVLRAAHIRPDVLEELDGGTRAGELDITVLTAAGLATRYDPTALELAITVPATASDAVSHDLGPEIPDVSEALRPSRTSGYLNLFARGGSDVAEQVRGEAVTTFEGWTLEARGDITRGLAPHRGDVTLVHDEPSSAIRFVAGDHAVPAAAFQPGYPLLGVGLLRNYSLQPYRVIQPVGVYDFVVEQSATVSVLVNGTVVQTLRVPAGHHDIRDLPLGVGTSAIELVIREDGGRERHLLFSTPNPNELLAPGLVQFSLDVGAPLLSDVGLRAYDWSRPLISGRRRWGITNRLTASVSLDATPSLQIASAGGTTASRFGTFTLDVGSSHQGGEQLGVAEGLWFDRSLVSRAGIHSMTLVAHHYSQTFHPFNLLEPLGQYRGDVALTLSCPVARKLTMRASGRLQVGRGESKDSYDASLAFTRFFGGLEIDALLGVRDSGQDRRDDHVFVTVAWQLPDGRGSIHGLSRFSRDSKPTSELRYSSLPGPPPGGLVASVSVRQTPEHVGGDASIGYTHDRFAGSITATQLGGLEMFGEVGTALAFAGGTVAWSRPIPGSFAIVDRTPALANHEVGVNPIRGHYSARANSLGPAVVANLAPFRLTPIRLESPELPVGTSLGDDTRDVVAGYRSGTLIVAGEAGTVLVRGSLVDSAGRPIPYAAGVLEHDGVGVCNRHSEELQARLDCIDETGAHSTSWALITNRAGRFALVAVSPGRYVVRLTSGERAEVMIPAGTSGLFSLGPVRIERTKPFP